MTFRAFISVDLEPKPEITEFTKKLRDCDAALKIVETQNIHLTLKFLGDINESIVNNILEIMRKGVEGVEPFTLKFRGTGAFPNLNCMNVIWIGIPNADTLIRISEYIDERLVELGFEREKRGFSPHITVARVKGQKNKDKLQRVIKENVNMDFGEQKVDCIKLKKSILGPKGPTYSTVEEVKFR